MKHLSAKAFCILLLAFQLIAPIAPAAAQSRQPEKNSQSLQSFFQQLMTKKAVVGGTVLRGDNDPALTGTAGVKKLLLADELVFKVMPGAHLMSLAWPSAPDENWELSIAGQAVQVQGGAAKIPVPGLALKGLHDWELKRKGSSKVQYAGHWFFIQNIEPTDTARLQELMTQAKAATPVQNPELYKVCDWMWQEQLVEFNDWCASP